MPALIAAASFKQKLGLQMVTIRRQASEPFVTIPVHITREATVQEYVEYHEREGLNWSIVPGEVYYEILMD